MFWRPPISESHLIANPLWEEGAQYVQLAMYNLLSKEDKKIIQITQLSLENVTFEFNNVISFHYIHESPNLESSPNLKHWFN